MRRALFAGAVAALVLAAPLGAQDPGAGMRSMNGSWVASLGGGVTLPVGDAADVFKTGWHANATIGFRPGGSSLTFLVDAGYHRAENKFLEGVDDTDTVEGAGNSNILTAFARINYQLGSSLYFLGGVGVLRREYPVEGANAIFTNTDAGIAGTVGLGLTIGRTIFLEGRLINKFSDPSLMIVPVTIGVSF